MIKMIEARDIKPGMIIATDGLRVSRTHYHPAKNAYFLEGVCHGVYKEAWFNANHELPVYVKEARNAIV